VNCTTSADEAFVMKHTILVVEDNPDILATNCEYLESLGYGVDSSPDGNEAKRKLRQKYYSLVLSDLRLGGGSAEGLDLFRFIRDNRPGTPIIVLTACGEPQLYLDAIRLGVTQIIDKPKPLAKIASIISETLSSTYARFDAVPEENAKEVVAKEKQ
jgi:CheY-like chemotaxis protein